MDGEWVGFVVRVSIYIYDARSIYSCSVHILDIYILYGGGLYISIIYYIYIYIYIYDMICIYIYPIYIYI